MIEQIEDLRYLLKNRKKAFIIPNIISENMKEIKHGTLVRVNFEIDDEKVALKIIEVKEVDEEFFKKNF